MKKNIDILLSVVDNYGDMGFACELLYWLASVYHDIFSYTLWTDDVMQVQHFFEYNDHILPSYCIQPIEQFWEGEWSSFCFSLFHGFLPKKEYFTLPACILRVDYISLDPIWLQHHESEHIGSTEERRIIEIIPSPLPHGWGILDSRIGKYSRTNIADAYQLDEHQEWITLFCYEQTLYDCIDLTHIPEDREVLILWVRWGAMSREMTGRNNIHFLPFLDIEEFHHILAYSQWSIIRGEISLMNILSLEKPFLWDMYKMIGGFHAKQSLDFLEYRQSSAAYRELHMKINGQAPWRITLSECESVFFNSRDQQEPTYSPGKNLINEVKKYIDSFYFSL